MRRMRRGYCQTDSAYLGGWVAREATVSRCFSLCLDDPVCRFAALKRGVTCSRYDASAAPCDAGGSADHTLYAKADFPCRPPTPPVSPAPPAPPIPPTSPPASPPARTIALLYHGDYYRDEPPHWDNSPRRCSDFFAAAPNHKALLIDPLRAMPMRVLIAFHTYRSACADRDAALVDFLQPAAYRFDDSHLPRIVDSYIAAIDVLRDFLEAGGSDEAAMNVDFVMLVRFDLMFARPLTAAPLRWDGVINFPWRDSGYLWDVMQAASDLWLLFPHARMPDVRAALDGAGDLDCTYNEPLICGTGHLTWRVVNESRGITGNASTHFLLHGGNHGSNLDGYLCAPWQPSSWIPDLSRDVPFYLLRECHVGDVCSPRLAACSSDSPNSPGAGGTKRYGAAEVGMSMYNGFEL